jgi:hypothetical protein
MAETTDEVRRDIELTRERMSTTLSQLERKVNVMQFVRDHPWPALGVALGAGIMLGRSGTDVKAAAATMAVTRGAGRRMNGLLDEVVSRLVQGLNEVVQSQIDAFIDNVKESLHPDRG